MKHHLSIVVVAVLALGLTACGGGSSGAGGGSSGLNNATSITGTIYAPNGDVMPSVTVSVPTAGAAMVVGKAKRTRFLAVTANGVTCDDPSQTACASTCSQADGTFTLDTTTCTGSESQIRIEKGNLLKVLDLNCTSGGICTLSTAESTFGSDSGTTTWPNVAVVTGMFDRMQDVLGKAAPTAYGTVDSNGQLQPGSENTTNLTLIDGANSLASTYADFETYLDGTNSLSGFDIVFINCGDVWETLLSNADVITRLQSYVTNGGTLYVTDLSYDFINQVFPSFMKFEGDTSATTPGAVGAAETGIAGIDGNMVVGSTEMSNWLGNVTVNDASGTDAPGNPDNDCTGGTYATRTGALNAAGKIPVGDFLSGWAHMTAAWDANTTIWISSGSGVTFDGLDNRPLTASRSGTDDSTLGTGRLFYSSYHTAEQCPTPNFWPQERILQYLVFEAF